MAESAAYPALLRAVRARLDLTQEQLADRLGVSFASVNRWEGGVNTPQKAAREAIMALAAEAGVDADRLAAGGAEAAAQVTRRRSAGRARRVAEPSTKPMEQMLWDAACSIRGDYACGSAGLLCCAETAVSGRPVLTECDAGLRSRTSPPNGPVGRALQAGGRPARSTAG